MTQKFCYQIIFITGEKWIYIALTFVNFRDNFSLETILNEIIICCLSSKTNNKIFYYFLLFFIDIWKVFY